jgi:hypothetical protein
MFSILEALHVGSQYLFEFIDRLYAPYHYTSFGWNELNDNF